MPSESQNTTGASSAEACKSVPDLIKDGQWDLVRDWYEAHPEEIRDHVDSSNGSTILHAICSISSAPVDLLALVADIWPEALTIQENRYGATPLHLLCWTVQRNCKKVNVLLERMKPEDLMIRNRVLGSTVLHSACGSHADLSVIKAIVEKHPPVLHSKTFDQHTALHALWHSHLQSIPMHVEIARILKGNEGQVQSELFKSFISKVNFLAEESFKLSSACRNPLQTIEGSLSRYILHGLLNMKAPLNAILVAIKLSPEAASCSDCEGNLPLHHAVIRRPFRVKFTKMLRELLKAHPQAATARNNAGDTPIHMAIRERIAWEDGLGEIVSMNRDVFELRDQRTGLYPFLLSASLGGNVAVNTTFSLLRAKPDLIQDTFI